MSYDMTDCLTVERPIIDDNSIVHISQDQMDKLKLGKGDYVSIEGKSAKETIGIVFSHDSVKDDRICMNKYFRGNLHVKYGDSCRVKLYTDLKPALKLVVLPFKDTALNLTGNLVDVFLMPYFTDSFRPMTVGDVFGIRGAMTHVDFKVISMDPSPSSVITNDTEISWRGNPIKRTVEDKYVTEVSFEDVGGHSTSLADIWDTIKLPLQHPEIYETTGTSWPCVAICGPEGSGKKLLAISLANESSVNFIPVNCHMLPSCSSAQCKATLRKAFKKAEKSKGLLFIDNFESLFICHDKILGDNHYPLVELFCTIADESLPGSYAILISAVNEDAFKPMLKWCNKKVVLQHPNVMERLEILKILTRNLSLSTEVDIKEIAEATQNCVGRELKAIVSMAVHLELQLKFSNYDNLDGFFDVDVISDLRISKASCQTAIQLNNLKRNPEETSARVPTISLEEFGGYEKLKSKLLEIIQLPMAHPEKFSTLGIRPPSGLLLYGPPGCGKTRLVQAICNSCQIKLISINGPEPISNEAGKSEETVRQIFKQARSIAPCVIYFDEMESISKARGLPGSSAVIERIIAQLLVEMDGVEKEKNVFCIGATNRPDWIDGALLRPGRLSELVYLGLPDEESRANIFEAILNKRRVDEGVDLVWLAKETDGFSSADLSWICSTAGMLAIKEAVAEEEQQTSTKDDDTTVELVIKRRHFEEVLSIAKPSVTAADLELYKTFSRAHRGRSAG